MSRYHGSASAFLAPAHSNKFRWLVCIRWANWRFVQRPLAAVNNRSIRDPGHSRPGWHGPATVSAAELDLPHGWGNAGEGDIAPRSRKVSRSHASDSPCRARAGARTARPSKNTPAGDINRIPDVPLPADWEGHPYSGVPVLFGHYWFTGKPEVISPQFACLDYSVAKDGPLVAYRWDGEIGLSSDKMVWV